MDALSIDKGTGHKVGEYHPNHPEYNPNSKLPTGKVFLDHYEIKDHTGMHYMPL